MRIDAMRLRDFRVFREFEVEFHPALTVIVGVNGAGKSSLLAASAIALSGLLTASGLMREPGMVPQIGDMLQGKNSFRLETGFTLGEGSFRQCLDATAKETLSGVETAIGYEGGNEQAAEWGERLRNRPDASFPLAVFYRSVRDVIDIPLETVRGAAPIRCDAYASALSACPAGSDFLPFFEWFRLAEDEENEERVDRPDFRHRGLEAVRQAVAKVTGMADPRIRRKRPALELRKNGHALDLRQLSDGEKCLFAMVGDLARRLAIANPGPGDPLSGKGVALIDEIELHLHPGWQRMILPKLLETFPGCQFIVTTHSPQVLGEIASDHILVLDQDKKSGDLISYRPKMSFGLDSSLILESLMESPARSAGVEREVAGIFRLIDDGEYAAAREKIAALRHSVKGDLPDMTRAEAIMAMLDG